MEMVHIQQWLLADPQCTSDMHQTYIIHMSETHQTCIRHRNHCIRVLWIMQGWTDGLTDL